MKNKLISLGLIVFLLAQFTTATHAGTITIGKPSAPSSVYVEQPFTVSWTISGADSTYKSTLQRKVNSGSWSTASSTYSGSGTFQDSEAISASGTVQYRVKVERWIINRYGEPERILIGYSSTTSVSVVAPVVSLSAPGTAWINTNFQVTWSVSSAYSGYATTLQYRLDGGSWTNKLTKTGPGYYNAYFIFSEPYTVEFRIVHNGKQLSSIKQTLVKVPDIVFWGKDHSNNTSATGTGRISLTTSGNDLNILMTVSTYWDIVEAKSGTAQIILSVTFTAPVSGYYYVHSQWKFDGKYYDDDKDYGPRTYMNLYATFKRNSFASPIGFPYQWGEPVAKWVDIRWYNQNMLFTFGDAQNGVYLDKGLTYELQITLEMGASGALPGTYTDYIDFYNYNGFFLQKTWIKFGHK